MRRVFSNTFFLNNMCENIFLRYVPKWGKYYIKANSFLMTDDNICAHFHLSHRVEMVILGKHLRARFLCLGFSRCWYLPYRRRENSFEERGESIYFIKHFHLLNLVLFRFYTLARIEHYSVSSSYGIKWTFPLFPVTQYTLMCLCALV